MEFEVGDTIMWTDPESPYARWFYSQIGVIKDISNGHCRIHWLSPVKYYNTYVTSSDFKLSNFSKPIKN